jgi:RNA polymerase sigma-70 factor (ECF subfamily)
MNRKNERTTIDARRRAGLMRQAQGGDRDAYRALLEELAPLLAAFLRRWAADRGDLDDLCQEALITVHRARHTYDSTRPIEPWLFAIARSVAADHYRREARRRAHEVTVAVLPEVASTDLSGAEQRLAEALATLPASQREAFELLSLDGLSSAEGARRAGITPAAIKVRAHRAYRALRALLRDD